MTAPGIAPFSGSIDQVTQMLQNIAESSAFAAEVTAWKAAQASVSSWRIVDATGTVQTLTVTPQTPNYDFVANAFAQVVQGPATRIEPPLPVLELVITPGRMQTSKDGDRMTTDQPGGAEDEVFTISSYIWAGTSDNPRLAMLEAMALAYCWKRLLRRNSPGPGGHLGGLVQLLQSTGPAKFMGRPTGGVATPDGNTVSALVSHEAFVQLP